jgi:hypothetical protein
MTARSADTPPPAGSSDRFAIVTLVDGSRFGARVRDTTVAGAAFVRCVVLATPTFTVDCAPTQIAKVTWCSLEEARAASPPSVVPIELRANDSKTSPPVAPPAAPTRDAPASPVSLAPDLIELVVLDEVVRVWLAVSRAQARAQGEMPAELASDLGAEDIEVRAENVVFKVAAEHEGRVRAELDARGVELVPVCSRCGCSDDQRCADGCAWADAARSICNRCNDSI